MNQKKKFLSLIFFSLCLVIPSAYTGSQLFSSPTIAAIAAPSPRPQTIGDPFIRTELFFGTQKPDGSEVTSKEWKKFLNNEITPRFPDGLTVLTGSGQFRNSTGEIIKETSRVLILLYPVGAQMESSFKIEQIREAYKQMFQQESVLRADDPFPVSVSF
ncbi:MAG TPA: DUF3574 domain-containing protein [Blastocatellia bacterium]|jgi:hypothetical protein